MEDVSHSSKIYIANTGILKNYYRIARRAVWYYSKMKRELEGFFFQFRSRYTALFKTIYLSCLYISSSTSDTEKYLNFVYSFQLLLLTPKAL